MNADSNEDGTNYKTITPTTNKEQKGTKHVVEIAFSLKITEMVS